MTRVYGVICDKCKSKIKMPSDHYVIKSHAQAGFNPSVTNDLCTKCLYELMHFISNPVKVE